jgi:hypothetical protein
MALTTALYYTPSGVNIHKTGIQPDIEVELPKLEKEQQEEIKTAVEKDQDYLMKLSNSSDTVEISSGTIIIHKENNASETYKLSGFVEPPDSFTRGKLQEFVINPYDSQLQRAVDILKSAEVFLPMMNEN